jgi:hypothetical protein
MMDCAMSGEHFSSIGSLRYLLVLAKQCGNGTKILWFLVKLEGIILHTNIQLGKEFVTSLLTKNVSNHWQRISVALNYFIKLAKVADPANSAVFLWCDERRWAPFAFTLYRKDANLY